MTAAAICDIAGIGYLNNRYHDPITNQFISVDPLVASTGEPYIYGAANPTTYSDPDGLCPISGPGSAEACKAYAAVDYTTTVHLTDDTLTVVTSGRPTAHYEREELSNSREGGVSVGDLADAAGWVSDTAGWVTLGCAAASTSVVLAPVGVPCVSVAAPTSVGAGAAEVALQIADGDVDRCDVAVLAVDALMPGPPISASEILSARGADLANAAITLFHGSSSKGIQAGCR